MSTVSRPRGPLPPRVYWTRRLLLVAVVLALVFAVSRLLGGSAESGDRADGPSAAPAAAPAGSPTAARTPSAGATGDPAPTATVPGKRNKKNGATKTPLAVPTGPCADSDVQVQPAVEDAVAGSDVAITLELTTAESPACTWQVSPESVVVKLTSGSDRIWSTQDCPAAVQRQSVVVRKDDMSTVQVRWSGQRSDDECTRTTAWAQPGYYFATAAALGAEPRERQFELRAPTAPTITATPRADRDKKKAAAEKKPD
jgi:hypothetical protein